MQPPILIIEGTEEQHKQALDIMSEEDPDDLGQNPDHATKEIDSMCVICWDQDAEEAIELACGHMYCKDCFHMQSLSNARDGKPIVCSGNNATCNAIAEINELGTYLQTSELDGVLAAAFQAYIQQRPKEVRNCPTPDCKSVFRVTTTPQSSMCAQCLAECCTSCFDAPHDDKSCEAHKQEQASDKQYEEWKARSGAQDCPNCNAAIEKNGGCNHMEFQVCHTHICWNCMATFKTGPETYDHMTEHHGGIFDLVALNLS